MGSMHTGLEEQQDGFEKVAAFYAERAKGGVGLIVTGGIAPDIFGRLTPGSAKMTNRREVRQHQKITSAVHKHDGKICMQILHAGRYAYLPWSVAPDAIQAPINPFKPWRMPSWFISKTIDNFVRAAKLAAEAGYDGVEVMGSEGYLINQFLVKRTNNRTDSWGGSFENRMRFPVEIVKRIRQKVGRDFIIIYRLSMLDLVEDGQTWKEVESLATAIESAGATLINTGIGWHEARIPTIAQMVPRGGFAWVTKRLMGTVKIPLITTNRINTPEVAENILNEGCADMISMARPFLADPDFMIKAHENRSDEINTCIACNQACLDHIFKRKTATCLVNPFACRETTMKIRTAPVSKKIAVVGAGPAGLAAAVTAAKCGHDVTLFESSNAIGGQLNMARTVSGKEEFNETIRYFNKQLELCGIRVVFDHTFSVNDVDSSFGKFDEVIVSTGVRPRTLNIPGIDLPNVLTYVEVLRDKRHVGQRVAIIGAGGIGIDVAMFLLKGSLPEDIDHFIEKWRVDKKYRSRGGLYESGSGKNDVADRKIFLLQRKKGKPGDALGKTTAWIHRQELKQYGVQYIDEISYEKITEEGLMINRNGISTLLEVDTVIICAGQVSENVLFSELSDKGVKVHLIGGAKEAGELDAKRAIEEGTTVSLAL